jgi:hypothetical protein
LRGRCTDGGGKADHNKADAGAQDTTPAVPTSDVAGSIWPYEGSTSPRTTNFGVTASCSITSSSNSRPVVASHILCSLNGVLRLSNYRLTTSTAAEDAKLGCQRSQAVAYNQRRAQSPLLEHANIFSRSSPASRTRSRFPRCNSCQCTIDFTLQVLPLGLQEFLRLLKLGN